MKLRKNNNKSTTTPNLPWTELIVRIIRTKTAQRPRNCSKIVSGKSPGGYRGARSEVPTLCRTRKPLCTVARKCSCKLTISFEGFVLDLFKIYAIFWQHPVVKTSVKCDKATLYSNAKRLTETVFVVLTQYVPKVEQLVKRIKLDVSLRTISLVLV